MKKLKVLSVALATIIAASCFSGCNNKENSSGTDSNNNSSNTETQDLNRRGEVRGLSATEIVAEMTTGWNLGNSFDALGGETAWGNPATTKEMVDAIAEKGFNTIRIPVTWGENIGEAPEYKINKEWLDRVQEVVNYGIDNNMYVIINSHHEEMWRFPDNERIEVTNNTSKALWSQIAERFKDYGDHLIFEGLNEPRIKDGKDEWTGGTEEGRKCVDILNQSFIDSVRATGGNNEKRLLLITTFASQAVKQSIQNVAIPDDKYFAMSIHAYTPYAFTYSPGESWELFEWDGSKDFEIDNMLYDLKETFVNKGIPVIITEFGAVNKFANSDEEVAKWVTHYLTTAKSIGIPCVWWDNGYYHTGNELFGIFNRNNCTWYTDTVVDAIMAVYAKK